MNDKFKEIVEKIETMSVIDLSELVKVLEEKFGVSASAGMMMAPGAAPGAAPEAASEKTEFAVHLTATGDQKIQIIKIVKEVLGLGLKEAKDLVDKAPTMLKEGMKKEEAEKMKADIEAAGGKAELK
ncbi:MAG: 50S ribosomal protein L7/L12 [Patescibacteria group bacterium]